MRSRLLLNNPAGDEKLYVEDVFSTYLYTGSGTGSQTISNGIDLSTKSGLVWIKARSSSSASTGHALFDTARGRGYGLATQSTAAQVGPSSSGTDLDAFLTNGFTVAGNNNWALDVSGIRYASWTFRKAAKFFDVVTGSGGGTFNHGLGVTPGLVIFKLTNDASSWYVYHRSTSSQTLYLNTTGAASGSNITTVTASTFTTTAFAGGGDQWVAYLFAHDETSDGLIQCGTYTGNGTTQDINLGWEPQWILSKMSNPTGSEASIQRSWRIIDNLRGMPVDLDNSLLLANTLDTENSSIDSYCYSPLANGFRVESQANQNGKTFVYVAIRRGPMKTPTTGTSVFSPTAYTATNVDNRLVNTGIVTDAVFARVRNVTSAGSFYVADRLRGNAAIATAVTSAEVTDADSFMTPTSGYGNSFSDMNGFGVGNDATRKLNYLTDSEIAYAFKRAPGFFDIVTYAGDGTNNRSLSHNLGVAPEMVIVKDRNDGGTFGWFVGHKNITSYQDLQLRSTNAAGTIGVDAFPIQLNGYTSTTFIVNQAGLSGAVNGSGVKYVAYLFATCPGVSKVGSYTGNGSSQTVNCGFSGGARFVLIKRSSGTGGSWWVWDTSRGILAGNDPRLAFNETGVEVGTTDDSIDTDSSGFIVNQNANTEVNASGSTYIYLAIA